MEKFVCWKCNASLDELPMPIRRSSQCLSCGIDLHVCKLCNNYDPKVANACREMIEDVPHDKERANFCDWFSAKANAFIANNDTGGSQARADLEALFGLESGASKQERNNPFGDMGAKESKSTSANDLFDFDKPKKE